MNAVGSETDDLLRGTPGDEDYRAGLGNDLIIDGRGQDVFTFELGDGQDRITTSGAADGFGVIAFGPGIALEGVTAKRDADGNIILLIAGSEDRLTLIDPQADPDAIVGTLRFADGRERSIAAMAAAIPATDSDDHVIVASGPLVQSGPEPGANLFGLAGNDWLESGRGADVLDGGIGNDLLQGHSGGDTYTFERGDGQDTIADVEQRDAAAIDVLRFGAGIAPGEIEVLSTGPLDLVIAIAGTSDRITIRDMFANVGRDGRIERFEFADGTTLTLDQILALAATGTDGDDLIDLGDERGFTTVVRGGAGNDTLDGGRGDTTYVLNPGDGQDVVEEGNWISTTDTVRFGAGLSKADMVAVRQGDDLLIRFVGSSDRLLVRDQYGFTSPPVEVFAFESETSLSAEEITALLIDEAAAQRLMYPSVADTDPFTDPVFARAHGDAPTGGGGDTETGAAAQPRRFVAQPGVVDTFGTFVPLVDDGAGLITIAGFEPGDLGDVLDIRLATGLAGEIVARQEGADIYVYFVDAGQTDLDAARRLFRLEGVALTDLSGGNFNGAPFATTAPQTLTGDATAEGLTGGWGDDTVRAESGDDTVTGAQGNDLLSGQAGNDSYILGPGFGDDTISEDGPNYTSPADKVVFAAGLTLADLQVTAEGGDLILTFANTGDRLRIASTMTNDRYRVETVEFADGTILSHAELVALALAPGEGDQDLQGSYNAESISGAGGNDTLTGRGGDDTLTGGTGNDLLRGQSQNDTYLFAPGFGDDTIFEDGPNYNSAADVIVLGAGYVPGDLRVVADGADLVLRFAGTEDRIRIQNTLTNDRYRVETLRFDDGTELRHAELAAMAWQPLPTDQRMDGSYDAEALATGGGNDTVYARGGDDTLTGGSGNDFLAGQFGNDTYVFDAGFGQDTIADDGPNYASPADRVVFGPGLERGDLWVVADGNDLILGFSGRSDSLRLQSTLGNDRYRIETVAFDDGTELSHAELVTLALVAGDGDDDLSGSFDAESLSGGAGNDTLRGQGGNDTLSGGLGNDFLEGGWNDDSYLFEAGFGHDTLSDNAPSYASGADEIVFGAGLSLDDLQARAVSDGIELRFGAGEDRLLIANGLLSDRYFIETLRFDDGRTLSRADLLTRLATGTAGDDSLAGDDAANAIDALAGNDTVQGNGGDDTITGGAGADSIAGGAQADDLGGDAGDDTILGDTGNDTLSGGAGFDRIEGGSNDDSLMGGDGNDTLDGGDHSDTLEGGAGNDWLTGGARDDTYRFGLGFGHDVIDEKVGSSFLSGTDAVVFDATITVADVTVYLDGDDLVLTVAGGDRLRILGTVAGGEKRVESVTFVADGTSWTHDAMMAAAQPWPGAEGLVQQGDPATNVLAGGAGDDQLLGLRQTASLMQGAGGNDTLTGGQGGETLDGGNGNDLLQGRDGNDTYRFGAGFGQDTIDDGGSNATGVNVDRVVFDASIAVSDVTIERAGPDEADLLLKFASGDRLTVVGGNLAAPATGGIDDVLFDDGTVWTLAQLQAMAGAPNPQGQQILAPTDPVDDTLTGDVGDDYLSGLLGDDTLRGGAGNDYLQGGDGNDVLDGGSGNDTLSGGAGVDTYRFAAGFGRDFLSGEYDDAGLGPSVLVFDPSLAPADLLVFVDPNGRLHLNFAGTDDWIELAGLGTGGEGANPIAFVARFEADGSTLSQADLQARATAVPAGQTVWGDIADDALTGTGRGPVLHGLGGNDTLTAQGPHADLQGGPGDDLLIAGAGRSTLDGGDGSDTFRVAGAFDQVRVFSDYGVTAGEVDILDLPDLLPTDVIAEYDSLSTAQLARVGGEGRILLSSLAVSEIRFSNSTVWSWDDFVALADAATQRGVSVSGGDNAGLISGSGFDDYLYGYSGAESILGLAGSDSIHGGLGDDTITGGAGHDSIDGGRGNDLMQFGAGFGHDVVRLSFYDTDQDVIAFGAGIAPGDISVTELIGGDLLLTTTGGDSLRLSGVAVRTPISEVRFDDGTTWTWDDLRALVSTTVAVQRGTAVDDILTGSAGGDDIEAGFGNDTIDAGAGDDYVDGGDGADEIAGGRGDDYLTDYAGGATFRFAAGFGQDTVDALLDGAPVNVVFDAPLLSSDLYVETPYPDGPLILRFAGTEDRVQIEAWVGTSEAYGVTEVRFADGTTFSQDDLRRMAVVPDSVELEGDPAILPPGGPGDDLLTGSARRNLLQGGAGNDTLDDQTGDDTLDGGPGDDLLRNGNGDDLFLFSAGFGQDVITYEAFAFDQDVIRFDGTILPASVQAELWDNDLSLRIDGSGDRILIERGASRQVFAEVQFADGTVWTRDDVLARAAARSGVVIDSVDRAETLTGTALPDLLDGMQGDDRISGLGDDDTLIAGSGHDTLTGGTGDDDLRDDGGDDTYVFAAGDGADTITDLAGTDVLQLGAGIAPGDVSVDRLGADDLLLRVGADRIVIRGGMEAGQAIESVTFADGTIWTHATLRAMALATGDGNDAVTGTGFGETIAGQGGDDTLDGAGGNDSLLGGTGSDQLSGGEGNDTLSGGAGRDLLDGGPGDDTYRFGTGDGNVIITDGDGANVLDLSAGILPGDVVVSALGDDIHLRLGATEDRVILRDAMIGTVVDVVRFDGGTLWGPAELLAMAQAGSGDVSGTDSDDTLAGSAANDRIDAMDGADLIEAGSGDDTVEGGAGNDTVSGGPGRDLLNDASGDDQYRFGLGDGEVRIADLSGTDAIALGTGIAPEDVAVSQMPDGSLLLRISGTEDRIVIDSALGDANRAIEVLRFADGREWTWAQMLAASQKGSDADQAFLGTDADETLAGQAGDDTIGGQGGADDIFGGAGSDDLSGGDGNDTLDGGTGSDALAGGAGDDLYRFGHGFGQDTITDTQGMDRVALGAGITLSDIRVSRSGDDLILRLFGTQDRLTIADALAGGTVTRVLFDDGSELDAQGLRALATAGTAGDDSYQGTADEDLLIGLGGNDSLSGLGGADDLRGGAGDDSLDGGDGADSLDGGPGDDTSSGGPGGDTYLFTAGDGLLRIDDQGDAADDDVLSIAGYGLDALRFSQTGADGADLTIRFAGSADRITVAGAFAGDAGKIERLRLSDSGAALSFEDITARVRPDRGVDGAVIYGDATAQSLTGTAQADYFEGGGGADTITGGDGDDVFGDLLTDDAQDSLTGGAGRDTYRYVPTAAVGTGIAVDVITDFTPGDAGDILRLASATPNPFANGRLQIQQDGADTQIILNADDGTSRPILRLLGVDATQLTAANFGGVAVTAVSTEVHGDDDPNTLTGGPLSEKVFGNGGADTITGLAGDDSLAGGADGDVIAGGYGNDALAGEAGNDDLSGGAGNDTLSGGPGDDTLRGSDDAAQFPGDDLFHGGTGNDLLIGGSEDDLYLYGANDGQDTITDTGGVDVIEFEAGILPDHVAVVLLGDDLELRVTTGDTRIRLTGAVADPVGTDIDSVVFADGTTWDRTDLLTRAMTATAGDDVLRILTGDSLGGLAGNDDLTGTDAADTLTGGAGDDTTRGGLGDDTYVFSLGGGQDLIDDAGGLSTLVLGAGILPGDVAVVPGLPTIVLQILGTGDRIDTGLTPDPEMPLQVQFTDVTTVWQASDLLAMALATTAGDDVVQGSDSSETVDGQAGDDRLMTAGGADDLRGGAGVDLLEGGLGDDTYRFDLGDDQDRIVDAGGADVFILGPGITPDDIRVAQSSDGSAMILAIGSDGDRVRIDSALGDGRIETVRFDDGSAWHMADLIARVPTALDDFIYGDEADNPLAGGLGDDRVSGGAGNDTYRFAAGDGRDILRDLSTSAADTLIVSGYAASDLRFTRLGTTSPDLRITFAGSQDDQIIIADGLATNGAGIERLVFEDDGTELTIPDILSLLADGQVSDDDDVIFGTDGADDLDGGAGDDLLIGLRGDDTFRFGAGGGSDRIDAFGSGQNLVILSGLNVADLASVARAGPGSADLVLSFTGGEQLTLVDALGSLNGLYGSLTLRFADGTQWARGDMRAAALDGVRTAGADVIEGFDGADAFTLTGGDDTVEGKAGSDTYRWTPGLGEVWIKDGGAALADLDVLYLSGVQVADVSVSRLFQGSTSVRFEFAGHPVDGLTVMDVLAGNATSVDQIVFDDGTIWTPQTLLELLDNNAPVATDDGFFAVTAGEDLVIDLADILSNDFDADGDTLRLVTVDGSPDGSATLPGDGTLRFTPVDGFLGATTIAYSITDDRNAFGDAVINVTVRPPAQVRDDDGFTMDEDGTLTIRVERLLSNDADGDRMVVGQVFDAVGGSVSLSSNGDISFTATPDFNGPAQFTYAANTLEGGRGEATVFIDVIPVNDAPVAGDDGGFTARQGTPLIVAASTLLSNDGDIDGDALTLAEVFSTPDLSVAIDADGNVVATPAPGFFGPATFEYRVEDAGGLSAIATATVDVIAATTGTEARDDRFDTDSNGDPLLEDNPVVIGLDRLLLNDNVSGDVTLAAVSGAQNGRAVLLDNQTVLFTPDQNFNGDGQFSYTIDDARGGRSTATAVLSFGAVNDRPVARDDSFRDPDSTHFLRGTQDQALEIALLDLLQNDYDVEGFGITFENATGPVHGSIQQTDDSVIFTPDAGFWGETTFGYSITDPDGAVDGAQVTIYFDPTSDAPPVAVSDQVLVPEDIPVTIKLDTLLANDSDVDGEPLEIIGWRYIDPLADFFKFGPAAVGFLNGTIEEDANGDFLFTPFIDATRSSGIVYSVTDNNDGVVEGFLDIVIVPSNDDPTVVEDPGFVTPLDVPLVIRVSDLLFNDYDIEQADTDGDGTIDHDLDDPDRARPTFVGVDALWDPVELAQGNRVPLGAFEIVEFRGEEFLVARFASGFSGDVTIEYRIADEEGLEDTGFAYATVADYYGRELSGTPQVDYIEGNALDEVIHGYNRDDWIVALGGNDTIQTGLGADFIQAGDGDDLIDAGDGNDDIRGGAGFDIVTFFGSNTGVRADLNTLIGQGGFAAGDQYVDIEGFIGTAYQDTLGGDDAANDLSGMDGDDLIEGRGGADTQTGGDGDDTLSGGAGGDSLSGGAGRDWASYEFGTEAVQVSLAGGTATGGDAQGDTLTGIENLLGGDAADQLEGDGSDNALSGGRGDDTLIGLGGNDTLSGGRGADDLRGGDGIDTADYSLSTEGIRIDLAAGTAIGGDAAGDTLSGIEIIEASYHDDVLAGDAADNTFRGSRGADDIDGRDGVDTADYTRATEAVAVNLATGQGTAGEAAGDRLTSIERLLGSIHNDTFTGSAGVDVFDGRFGADLLIGAGGSDRYLFGFDSGADTIIDTGDASDTDQLRLGAGIAEKDVSLLRVGDDLFVELERDDGYLIDTVTVTGHFLGTATGIEQIVFEDGTIWDRAAMDARLRDGRFNAMDDIFRLGVEDEVAIIDPADLVLNDAETGVGDLVLVSVQAAQDGSVSINSDGMIEFLGAQDFNGDAFFAYTVRDPMGRDSTARVEVNLSPVNDAPVAVDDPLQYGIEDVPLRIRIENLLANDYDVDGDAESEKLRIVSLQPLTNADGEALRPYEDKDNYDGPATDMTWKIDGKYIELLSRPDHFGFAGFRYVLEDGDGAQSTADVEVYLAPVNDAPRIRDGAEWAKLGETTTFTVDQMMRKVYDVEDDGFTFVGLHIGADGNASFNGTEVFDAAQGLVHFTPDALGDAHISFDVIDDLGAEATLDFNIQVRPQNLPPSAKDDRGFRLLQDGVITIDPADLLANDTDPDDDVLVFDSVYRFAENGKVRVNADGMIEFAARSDYNGAASFEYTISDGRGGFDSAVVHLTILPVNTGPELRGDVVTGLEDGPLYVIPAEAFGNDLDLDGDVLFFESAALLGELTQQYLSPNYTVRATAPNNADLPDWLSFDAATMTFTGDVPADHEGPVEVAVFLTDPSNGGVHVARFSWSSPSHKADLSTGVSVEAQVLDGFRIREAFDWSLDDTGAGIASFDISDGVFSAQVNGGRALPSWLVFDDATRSLSMSDFGVEDTDSPARVQIVFTPGARPDLPDDVYYATDRGFTLEFVIDPTDPQLDAFNAVLAGDPSLEGAGLFGLDLSSAPTLTVARESGAPLDDWLSFDAGTLSFSGLPPSRYVGAVPVRIDVAGDGALPAMSLITEAVVDETFAVITPGNDTPFAVRDLPERIDLTAPGDFTGAIALTYTAEDEKGGQSDAPASIVFNVTPTRELAVAGEDRVDLFEGGSVTFNVADLLLNDRDDDGDPLRITGFGTAANGTVVVTPGMVTIAAPAGLAPLPGGTWSAALAGRDALPDWMSVDAATGALTAVIPLDLTGSYDVVFANTDGTVTRSDTVTAFFDGNAGAVVSYTPDPAFAGEESLTYTLTDDAEGPVTGTVLLDVASLLDPPIAATDRFDAYEDGTLVLTPDMLLANDSDVDGDPIRFLGVDGGVNGTVMLDGDQITFTPDPDFAGQASFTYRVTDDRHGESIGTVEVSVISTNQAPEAVTDIFAATEDTPYEFTITDLLANDTDPDGDTLTFVKLSGEGRDGRILELPDGRYQFVPDENVTGQVSFSYIVTDGRLRDTGTISFDIAPVNDAPIANPDGFFLGDQDAPIVVDFADLLINDRDVEGDAFSIVEVFDGDNGTVYRDGETAVFQGRPGYFGDGGFSYRVTDVHGATSIGYAQVLVLPLFDVPVAVSDDGYEMLEDSYLDLDPADLMANDDIPLGSEVIFLGLSAGFGHVGNATVAELDNGLWRVTTAPDFFGELVLRYALTNETGFEVPTTVTIDVIGTADAPGAGDDQLTILEDLQTAIFVTELLANDSDPDRQGFALTRLLDAEGVTVELTADGQVLITPPDGFHGDAWFEYEIADSDGLTDTARVSVRVEAQNDAPVITDPGLLLADKGAAVAITLPAGTVVDPDGDALVVELRSPGGAALPDWLAFEPATQTLTGQPPDGFSGDVALELFVSDGQAEVIQALTLRIPAADGNSAPVLAAPVADQHATEDAAFALTLPSDPFTDADGDALAFALSLADGGALPAWMAFDAVTLALTGTPPADFNGTVPLRLTASDGQAQATSDFALIVDPVNDAPVITSADAVSVVGDATLVGTITATDLEGDGITFAISGGADAALFTLVAGQLSFAAIPDFQAPRDANGDNVYEVQVTASDGTDGVGQLMRITVMPPATAITTGTITEGDLGDVARASGVLSPAMTYADLAATPGESGFGSFVLSSGVWTYTLDQTAVQQLAAGDTVTDAITYVSSGGVAQRVTMTILGTGDAPTLSNLPAVLTVQEDVASPIDLSATDLTDPDSAVLELRLSLNTGSFAAPADGTALGVTATQISTTLISLTGRTEAINAYLDTATNIRYVTPLNTFGTLVATLTLLADDQSALGQVALGQVQIGAVPVNDAPHDVILTGGTVQENAAAGTVVGGLAAVDVDGDRHDFSLVSDPSGLFAIDGANLVVAPGAQVDFETSATHTVTVRATDVGGLSFDKALTIAVTDVDDGGPGPDDGGVTVVPVGGGTEVITLGTGQTELRGRVQDFNGDTFNGFDTEDTFVFTDAMVARDAITFDRAAGTLSIDSNGDGTPDQTITLTGDFSGGDFMAVTRDGQTRITFEPYLPKLNESTPVDLSQVNGITNQDYLTGDGMTGFRVEVLPMLGRARFDNSLGVYEVNSAGDIVDVRVLSASTQILPGGPQFDVTGVENGHQLGLFIVQNGFGWASRLAAGDTFDFVDAVTGGTANILSGTGATLTVNGIDAGQTVFHSIESALNPTGLQHALSGVVQGGQAIIVGFEDLIGGGDRDYQDVVFTVTTIDDIL
ncbi:tandem-95 repeat protein [Mesobacterium sp. TK19101]|uniref:Tandem-95 repeat protein n=1 Tax=Mesobacterium hydrothermale TaxID=3111907 RepID=A0ABU6HDV3_9RHOB|nr:tandem-95 repeat protein [Mesobacterium sp. TK19101]MEC3860643.1 tandem-95 repeat protein [Mesobacterium sp. TK19101]